MPSLLLPFALAAASAFAPPPLVPLADAAAVKSSHAFSDTASWVVPGAVLLGRYPGSCPSRPITHDAQAELVMSLRRAGITTFVCLQSELQPQDTCTADEPAPGFRSYVADTGTDARFVHFGIPDREPAASLEALDGLVRDLAARVHSGEALYIHCYGGQGRTGLVAACLLGALYASVEAAEALARVQAYFLLRGALRPGKSPRSPETDAQEAQVRAWFAEWRPRRIEVAASGVEVVPPK